MIDIPALQTVARAKRQQIAVGITTVVASMLIAFLLVGVFEMSAWMILVCMLAGILLAVVICSRIFIRWRLRAYNKAQNIKQLHLIAQVSDMEVKPDSELLLAAISSTTEIRRWKDLLESANT